MPATKEKPTRSKVEPFGVEADHPRNSDLLLQNIPNMRLRSAISASRTVKDAKTGDELVPMDQARSLGMFPRVPGMEIHVDPANLTYTVRDPLHNNEEMCERIRRRLDESSPFRASDKIEGVPPQKGTLDKHQMKTLVRELVWLLENGQARTVKGTQPKLEEVDTLPGDYLLDPGSRISNSRPKFEKDLDEWVQNLNRMGG